MKPISPQPTKRDWHSQSSEEALAQLGPAATGLSTAEATKRLAADGTSVAVEQGCVGRRETTFTATAKP